MQALVFPAMLNLNCTNTIKHNFEEKTTLNGSMNVFTCTMFCIIMTYEGLCAHTTKNLNLPIRIAVEVKLWKLICYLIHELKKYKVIFALQ